MSTLAIEDPALAAVIAKIDAKETEAKRRAQFRVDREHVPLLFTLYTKEELAVDAVKALPDVQMRTRAQCASDPSVMQQALSVNARNVAEAIAEALRPHEGGFLGTRDAVFLQRLIDDCGVDINDDMLRDVCLERRLENGGDYTWHTLFSHPGFCLGGMLTAVSKSSPGSWAGFSRYGATVRLVANLPLETRFGPCITGDPELLSHYYVIHSQSLQHDIWRSGLEIDTIHRELLMIEPLRQLVARTLHGTEMQVERTLRDTEPQVTTTPWTHWASVLPVVFAYLLPPQSDVDEVLRICRERSTDDRILAAQIEVADAVDALAAPPVEFREPPRPAAAAAAAAAAAPRRFSARLRARASALAPAPAPVAASAAPVVAAPVHAGRKRKTAAVASAGRGAKLQRTA